MANILDIFRTNTGEKLLKRSMEITDLNSEDLKCTFIFSFPALLSAYMQKKDFEAQKPDNLVEFIEGGDLVDLGKNSIQAILSEEAQKTIIEYSGILNIEKNSFEKVLYISKSVLNVIISEILKENRNSDFSGIIKCLAGLETKYDEDFVKVLIKNPDEPNLIDSRENIALGKGKDDNDQSILGGYTGGR